MTLLGSTTRLSSAGSLQRPMQGAGEEDEEEDGWTRISDESREGAQTAQTAQPAAGSVISRYISRMLG
jgi:hypothetical protein